MAVTQLVFDRLHYCYGRSQSSPIHLIWSSFVTDMWCVKHCEQSDNEVQLEQPDIQTENKKIK